MRVICGWHKRYFPHEPPFIIVPDDGGAPGSTPRDSHGLCRACFVMHLIEQHGASEAAITVYPGDTVAITPARLRSAFNALGSLRFELTIRLDDRDTEPDANKDPS